MDEARLGSSGALIAADRFASLPPGVQSSYRAILLCPACGADAYYIREARNGRRACFGARPHETDCELASMPTGGGGSAALDETDERINAGDVFNLEPIRRGVIRHVTHDPQGAPGTGTAVRYTQRGQRRVRISSIGIERLLRQLVTRPGFASSRTMLNLPNDTRGTVKTVCREVREVQANEVGRRRIYWGTIRFPQLADDGGAWLNTGSRLTPTVKIDREALETILAEKRMDDLDDLSGSYFAFWGPLRQGPSGKLMIFADDERWFAVRPYDDDTDLN